MKQNYTIDGKIYKLKFLGVSNNEYLDFNINGKIYSIKPIQTDGELSLVWNNKVYNITRLEESLIINKHNVKVRNIGLWNRLKNRTSIISSGKNKTKRLISPLPGKITKILVVEGRKYKKGDILIIISAMKMENRLIAEHDCKISKIHIKENAIVAENDCLISFD
ncbi:MAG: acetyl-CoA carboxylase biotin carboxyl carrier protein subunit [Marinifilaceae bacterium]|jgi:acetyl/propionyl-CoA carboxylase alpha subunit|nr:acetyl-CoA carboxylase biotin carboxyl carrier protein subunit [Marinifilaceae bacterium]